MQYLSDAFTLDMLGAFPALPLIREVDLETVRADLTTGAVDGKTFHACTACTLRPDVEAVFLHAGTALIVDRLWGLPFTEVAEHAAFVTGTTTHHRIDIVLHPGDVLYVAQHRGPRKARPPCPGRRRSAGPRSRSRPSRPPCCGAWSWTSSTVDQATLLHGGPP